MMSRRPLTPFAAVNIVISVLVGVLVLAGSFLAGNAAVLVQVFGDWAVTITVFALLLGFVNVLRVHISRVVAQRDGWPYSVALVLSALIVLVLGFSGNWTVGDPAVQWVFQWVYQPIGTSLFALFAFFVVSAAFRALRAGPSAAWVLLAVAVVVSLGLAPWSAAVGSPLGGLATLANWTVSYPGLAGLRGILLGAALGAIATSVRVLIGVDRPYMS